MGLFSLDPNYGDPGQSYSMDTGQPIQSPIKVPPVAPESAPAPTSQDTPSPTTTPVEMVPAGPTHITIQGKVYTATLSKPMPKQDVVNMFFSRVGYNPDDSALKHPIDAAKIAIDAVTGGPNGSRASIGDVAVGAGENVLAGVTGMYHAAMGALTTPIAAADPNNTVAQNWKDSQDKAYSPKTYAGKDIAEKFTVGMQKAGEFAGDSLANFAKMTGQNTQVQAIGYATGQALPMAVLLLSGFVKGDRPSNYIGKETPPAKAPEPAGPSPRSGGEVLATPQEFASMMPKDSNPAHVDAAYQSYLESHVPTTPKPPESSVQPTSAPDLGPSIAQGATTAADRAINVQGVNDSKATDIALSQSNDAKIAATEIADKKQSEIDQAYAQKIAQDKADMVAKQAAEDHQTQILDQQRQVAEAQNVFDDKQNARVDNLVRKSTYPVGTFYSGLDPRLLADALRYIKEPLDKFTKILSDKYGERVKDQLPYIYTKIRAAGIVPSETSSNLVNKITQPSHSSMTSDVAKQIYRSTNPLDHIGSREAVLWDIQQMAKEIGPLWDKQSHAQTLAYAKQIFGSQSLSDISKLNTALKKAPQQTIAAVHSMIDSRVELEKMAEFVRENPTKVTPEHKIAMETAAARFLAYQEAALHLPSYGGRFLDAMKHITANLHDTKIIAEKLEEYSNGKFDIYKLSDDILTAKDIKAFSSKVKGHLRPPGIMDMVLEYAINKMLNGLKTQVANFGGNTIRLGLTVPETYLHAFLNKVLPGNGELGFTGANARALASISGIKEASIAFVKTFWEGKSMDNQTKMNLLQHQAIRGSTIGLDNLSNNPINRYAAKAVDLIGHYERLPGRTLLAVDDFFKTLARRMSINQQAADLALAQSKGKTMAERMQLQNDLVANPSEQMLAKAVEESHLYTFTNDLGQLGRQFQHATTNPFIRFNIPFVKTMTNMFKTTVGYSGGYLTKGLSQLVTREKNIDIRNSNLAKGLIGAGIMMYVYDLAQRGKLTGQGPTLKGTQAAWRQTHQPYSYIDDQGNYHSLTRIAGTFAPTIGAIADYAYAENSMNDDEKNDAVNFMFKSISNNVFNNLWLQGVLNLTNVLQQAVSGDSTSITSTLKEYAAGVGGTFAGNMENDIRRQQDPRVRDPSAVGNQNPTPSELIPSMWESMKAGYMAKTPGITKTPWFEKVPLKVSVWGDPILSDNSMVNIMTKMNANEIDPVKLKVSQAKASLPVFPSSDQGVKFTPEQVIAGKMMMGHNAYEALKPIVSSPDWNSLSLYVKQQYITKTFDKTLLQAKGAVIASPSFRIKDIVDKKMQEINKK